MKGVRPEGGKTSTSRVSDHKKYSMENERIFGKKRRVQWVAPPIEKDQDNEKCTSESES